MRACTDCEYDGANGCAFPEPQKGGSAPFMVMAAMPDPRDGGAGCFQFCECRETRKKREEAAHKVRP